MRHGDSTIPAEVDVQLCHMSPSTIDRILRHWRGLVGRCSSLRLSPGACSKDLSPSVPLLTFRRTNLSFLILTWCPIVARAASASTSAPFPQWMWPVVGQRALESGVKDRSVCGAFHRLRQRLPFSLLGLDSDNGSEFINQHLYNY
jgi:hypothetical protein